MIEPSFRDLLRAYGVRAAEVRVTMDERAAFAAFQDLQRMEEELCGRWDGLVKHVGAVATALGPAKQAMDQLMVEAGRHGNP